MRLRFGGAILLSVVLGSSAASSSEEVHDSATATRVARDQCFYENEKPQKALPFRDFWIVRSDRMHEARIDRRDGTVSECALLILTMLDGSVQLEGERYSQPEPLRAKLAEINRRIPTPALQLRSGEIGPCDGDPFKAARELLTKAGFLKPGEVIIEDRLCGGRPQFRPLPDSKPFTIPQIQLLPDSKPLTIP